MEIEHKISIIGSTGSIGTQTLETARTCPGIRILGLSAYSNTELLEKQAREFMPEMVCIAKDELFGDLKTRLADTPIRVVSGEEGLVETAALPEADTTVTAVVGISGLAPTVEAIKAGKNIALANKETLVTGGHIVMPLAKDNNVKILPVDSEHSAIFQSLEGCAGHGEIKRLILTASGGPFFGKSKEELLNITPSEALKHPNWDMGAKVTIDSSTLVNKGLEVIEAKWLFGVDIDRIEVLVHPQSVVHSMVEFADNGIIAQLGAPDMRLPIQYAITYPHRLPIAGNELDFAKYPALTFQKPDTDTFYALKLAYEAGRSGGNLPCIFNSADEEAVRLFLENKIGYLKITELIKNAMDNLPRLEKPSLEEIYNTDAEAREYVRRYV